MGATWSDPKDRGQRRLFKDSRLDIVRNLKEKLATVETPDVSLFKDGGHAHN